MEKLHGVIDQLCTTAELLFPILFGVRGCVVCVCDSILYEFAI